MKYKVTVEIDRKDVESLLVSAFEGGSNYWYRIEEGGNSRNYLRDAFSDKGLVISNYFACGPDEKPRKATLHLNAVLRGLKKMAAHKDGVRHFGDLLAGNADGLTGDVFLQFCLFGQVIYG